MVYQLDKLESFYSLLSNISKIDINIIRTKNIIDFQKIYYDFINYLYQCITLISTENKDYDLREFDKRLDICQKNDKESKIIVEKFINKSFIKEWFIEWWLDFIIYPCLKFSSISEILSLSMNDLIDFRNSIKRINELDYSREWINMIDQKIDRESSEQIKTDKGFVTPNQEYIELRKKQLEDLYYHGKVYNEIEEKNKALNDASDYWNSDIWKSKGF